MVNREGEREGLNKPRNIMQAFRDRLFSTQESRERKVIQGLPPIIMRLFGNIDYEEQLRDIPGKFREKVIILTTSDTSSETIARLKENQWNVVQSSTVTDQEARENSGMLLNEAMKFGKENNVPYLFFLSSGFQGSLDMFYSMYYEVTQKYPHQDAYYFVLPETHIGLSTKTPSIESIEDVEDFLLRKFPFETALVIRTDFLQLETNLSRKGAMGSVEQGIPLGGMEFFLTLLSAYKRARDQKGIFIPKMIGITLPVLLQRNGRLQVLIKDPYERKNYETMNAVSSLQVTSPEDKLARRIPTWREAMKRLALSEDDIRQLFSATTFENGLYHLHHFTDSINFNGI